MASWRDMNATEVGDYADKVLGIKGQDKSVLTPEQFVRDRSAPHRIDRSQPYGSFDNPKSSTEFDEDLRAALKQMMNELRQTGKPSPDLLKELRALHNEGWIEDDEYNQYLDEYNGLLNGTPMS